VLVEELRAGQWLPDGLGKGLERSRSFAATLASQAPSPAVASGG
jgi:hypothetical protein